MLSPWQVLDVRVVKRLDTIMPQLLIQWEDTEVKDATWEDLQEIRDSYPMFNLEDKVVFDEEGNVTARKQSETMAPNSVRNEGHVGVRHSTRQRRENIRLRDYTNGGRF
ncbi:Retrotransposable element Tf2 [Sesbania bispinosa]|nr:Retrotransposable element Tf2 [Sesbania bispinosa]